MFKSGNFYVEYHTTEYFGDMLALHRARLKRSSGGIDGIFGFSIIGNNKDYEVIAGKDGNRIKKANAKAKQPEFLYQNGKYYKFWSKVVNAKKLSRK